MKTTREKHVAFDVCLHFLMVSESLQQLCSVLMVHKSECLRQVDDELEIKAYYAGHVLGAAMVHIKVGSESVVYTVSANKHGAFTHKDPHSGHVLLCSSLVKTE